MDDPLPPGLAQKVNKHLEKTTGIILASRQPCLGIVEQEAVGGRVRGRRFVTFPLPELVAWRPPRSWVLGYLLCPGDDAGPIVGWIHANGIQDLERIRFYLYRGVDEAVAMRPWVMAGLPYRARTIDTWQALHTRFGRQHAFWVLRDHAPDARYVS